MAVNPSYTIKNICILSGNRYGKQREFIDESLRLGQLLADRKIHVVYEGGDCGLSKLVAQIAQREGCQVLGIVTSVLKPIINPSGKNIGEELVVSTMQEQISAMILHADAFIILPGDLTAFDTLSTLLSWAQLNFHNKPIGLLNINNYFKSFISLINHGIDSQFIPSTVLKFLATARTSNILLDLLQGYKPQTVLVPTTLVWKIKEEGKNTNKEEGTSDGELDLTLHL